MIREMTLSDAIYVIERMRKSDRRALSAVCPGMTDEQFAIDRFSTDYHYTVTVDGVPAVIGGARILVTKTATLWIVATSRLPEVKLSMMRFAKRFAIGLLSQGIAHRLEGQWLADETTCERFAKHFGLEFDGCRRKGGAGGEDIMIYGKVA